VHNVFGLCTANTTSYGEGKGKEGRLQNEAEARENFDEENIYASAHYAVRSFRLEEERKKGEKTRPRQRTIPALVVIH